MIDVDDSETLIELDRQAKNLSALSGARLEREIEAIRQRAVAGFTASGDDDLTAWFSADAIVTRLRALVANHRRRAESDRLSRVRDGERPPCSARGSIRPSARRGPAGRG